MNDTATHVGNVLIIDSNLADITGEGVAETGRIALAIQIGHDKTPIAILVWSWGGDWDGFGDDAETIDENILDALETALDAAVDRYTAEVNEDLDWFRRWLETAKGSLAARPR